VVERPVEETEVKPLVLNLKLMRKMRDSLSLETTIERQRRRMKAIAQVTKRKLKEEEEGEEEPEVDTLEEMMKIKLDHLEPREEQTESTSVKPEMREEQTESNSDKQESREEDTEEEVKEVIEVASTETNEPDTLWPLILNLQIIIKFKCFIDLDNCFLSLRLMVLSVEINVSLQNVFKWSKQPFKGVAIQLHALTRCLCENTCCSWLVSKQCQLSKVVTGAILLDFSVHSFYQFAGIGLSVHKEIEFSSFVSFLDDCLSLLKIHILEGFRDLRALVVLHSFKQFNLFEEIFIFFFLANSCIFDYVVKRSSIKYIKKRFSIRSDSCCSWSVIEKRKFSKCFARFVCLQQSSV
jgi:hypothetical protein